MRRILAIGLTIFILFWAIFWVSYAAFPLVQATVNDFALEVAGPTLYGTVNTVYLGIVNSVGIPGLTAIILGCGFIVGIVTHRLWVSADWRIRRWGQQRTAKDLGTTTVTSMPSTPPGATTRPTKETVASPKEKESQPETSIAEEDTT